MRPLKVYYQQLSTAFPEARLSGDVNRHCSCFARRVGTSHTRAEFEANSAVIGKRYGEEAGKGGPCKPDGLLAELIRKEGGMR